jgi:hypothetical protein
MSPSAYVAIAPSRSTRWGPTKHWISRPIHDGDDLPRHLIDVHILAYSALFFLCFEDGLRSRCPCSLNGCLLDLPAQGIGKGRWSARQALR